MMGYSISVSFTNKEEKENLLSFLTKEERLVRKILGYKISINEPINENGQIVDEKHLSYKPDKKNLLGFNSKIISTSLWAFCAWLAVKSEKRDKENNPFIYYDNIKFPISFDESNVKNIVVDENGIILTKIIQRDMEDSLNVTKSFFQQTHANEELELEAYMEAMSILNDKWNEFKAVEKKNNKKRVLK
jgi:hypothetical protein